MFSSTAEAGHITSHHPAGVVHFNQVASALSATNDCQSTHTHNLVSVVS